MIGKSNKGPKDRKPKEKKPSKRLGELYNISGDSIERKNKFCPKCGKGFFLAAHKDRSVCGKCKYVEMISKKEAPKEE
ncbi:30S ribosomal protein S27ae [Candidatus Woesearchaeota archaeon]|jgi:ubiquitin-small subunit ribosomal protein S27Ae|nr:30S ribosomal protein S27ae [Candidatus Woesearchaeota archaeon]